MNILCVLLFLTWLPSTRAFGDRVEQTPREVTKQPGETLTIDCVFKETSCGLESTYWYRQRPGETQLERLSIGGDYIESVYKSTKTFSLQIRNLIVQESATYFCQACGTKSSGCGYDWDNCEKGGGTELTVRYASSPNINVYSATDERRTRGYVKLICILSEYLPESISVSWQKNRQTVYSGFTTSPAAKTSGGTFTSTSVLEVPQNEWASGTVYSCQVSHYATSSNIRKDIRTESGFALFLRDPTVEEMWRNKTATLVCEVIATTPAEVSISWRVGGRERADGIQTRQATKIGSQYVTVSRLTSRVSEWDSGVEYSCSVQNDQLAAPLSKQTRNAKARPLEPKVLLLPPSPEQIQTAGIATLTCMITGFYPDDITVLWQKDGAALDSNATSFLTALQQDMTFNTRSLLSVTAADWKKDATYSCVVTHPPSQSTVKANITKEECREVDINAIIKKPSFEEIWTLQKATVVCEVVYTDLQNVTVSWRVNGNQRMNGVETHGPERRGGKFIILSKLKVSAEEWNSGTEYLCFVEGRDLPTPLTIATKKPKVTEVRRPNVYLLHPSAEEIQAEEAATLICLASGFYPDDIYVGWMANDTPLHSGYSVLFNSDKENGCNSVTSKLRISAEDWEKGTTYSCLVGHPSLQASLIRSINKSHGKPTLVNVSLVLTDSFKSCV